MKHVFYAVLTAALFISCVNEEQININPEEPSTEASQDNCNGMYEPGEAYVYFTDEMAALIEDDLAAGSLQTKSAALNSSLEAYGITEMRRVFPHAGKFEPRTRKHGLHKWYVVKYTSDIPVTKAAEGFLAMEGIEFAEPARRIRLNDFNDPRLGDLWGLNNVQHPEFDINVKPVWENYTTGNPDVIVAVVDAGVDYTHEDLAENCVDPSLHYNAVPGVSKIEPGAHGTHVAGTIAAVSNNGVGVSGIAGGDKAKGQAGVKILSCQIFAGDLGCKVAESAEAIKEGADRGAVISQNSWGYVFDKDDDKHLSPSELEEAKRTTCDPLHAAAIKYFIDEAGYDENGNQDGPMAGGVVFFAAGNDGSQYGAPAENENVIAVGSIDPDGKRSDFSNYGDWVDIAAPGRNIWSTVPKGYMSINGTSMACPHVSGVAALLVSHFGGPGFTNEMLKEALLATANKELVPDSYKIGGLVDAYSAFRYINDRDVDVDPVTDLEAEAKQNKMALSWTTPKNSNGEAAYGFLILYGQNREELENALPDNHAESVKTIAYVPGTAVGKTVKYNVTKLEFEKTYYAKVMSYSFGRRFAEASSVVEVTTEANNAPVITIAGEDNLVIKSSQNITIPVEASDADGHTITMEYEAGSTADTFKSLSEGKWQISIIGNAADEGEYTATIKAVDEYGLSSVRTLTYKILPNRAPVKLKDIDNVMLTAKGREFSFDMTEYVNDPDEDKLKYEITISDPKVLHMVTKGDRLTGASLGYGMADVEIKAKDARGEAAVFMFKVQVKDPSDPLSVYPNPVTDYVNVGTLDAAETRIRVVGQTGQTVYEETLTVSGYEPAKIDMSSCPPGMYVVIVNFGDKEYKKNIIKL